MSTNRVQLAKQKQMANRKPRTVRDMVNSAIRALKNPNGSSLAAIKNYIGSKYEVSLDAIASQVKQYIKESLSKQASKQALIQAAGVGARGSFKLPSKNPAQKTAIKGVSNISAGSSCTSHVTTPDHKLPTARHSRSSKSSAEVLTGKKTGGRQAASCQSSRTKRSAQSQKKALTSVPSEEAYSFFVALLSGNPNQRRRYREYLTLPFNIELKTFDHEYCTCVQTSLEQLEKLDCNVNLIKKLLDGSMTSLKCQKQKKVKSRKMRDNGNKVIRFFPIHVAAALGDVQLLNQILNRGGNMLMYTKSSPKGLYPFELSLHHLNLGVADILIQRGFSYQSPLNKKSKWEINQAVSMVKLIERACMNTEGLRSVTLAHKAGIKLESPVFEDHFRDALEDCLERDDLDVLKCILSVAERPLHEIVLFSEHSVLYLAKSAEAVHVLFDHGFDLKAFSAYRKQTYKHSKPTQTVLYPVIKQKRIAVAQSIIERCPEVMDEVGRFQRTALSKEFGEVKPIHMCAIKCLYDGLELLLKSGAKADELSPGPEKRSILQMLCLSKAPSDLRYKCVDLLFKHQVTNINVPDAAGDLPLVSAAELGDRILLQKLLKHGADPSMIKASNNCSALWYFVGHNSLANKDSIILPLLYANPSQESLMPAVSENRTSRVSYHLPNERVSPQMVAVYRQDIASLRGFIESGWFVHQARYQEPCFEPYLIRWGDANRKWLEDSHLSKPPSLTWWAKRRIRSSLPVHPYHAVKMLGLPTQLKEYILQVDDLPADKTENLKNFEWWPEDGLSSAVDRYSFHSNLAYFTDTSSDSGGSSDGDSDEEEPLADEYSDDSYYSHRRFSSSEEEEEDY